MARSFAILLARALDRLLKTLTFLAMADVEGRMVSDAVRESFVHRLLPLSWWPYAQLARWERPIGWQLLMWPCWWSLMLAADAHPELAHPWTILFFLALFFAGSVIMRGAGCTYNDLVDQDIDDRVARTRSRPLPSGRVTRLQAKLFLVAQLFGGLLVLLQFGWFARGVGVVSLLLVAIYPFMKRITWWPQFFLGLAFSWGALMGWAGLVHSLSAAPLLLYAGSVLWVIGYDTIYAHQDIEDDALVGVKSTARLFGNNTRRALALLYAGAAILFAAAWLAAGMGPFAWIGLAAGIAQLAWQVNSLDIADPRKCLALFRSNGRFGAILFFGLAVELVLSSVR
jgi:4-hydroxybenzoate polyprenyltransferase